MSNKIQITRKDSNGYIELTFRSNSGKEYLAITIIPRKKDLYIYTIGGVNAQRLIFVAKRELIEIAKEKKVKLITTDIIEKDSLKKISKKFGFKKSKIRNLLHMPFGGNSITTQRLIPMKLKIRKK